ncbi:hypothetical protein BJV82DRAFT_660361 [Fennellomyces sp. T-0311]|nr:hypothetical protein BJV82DRAFT_660361 [Fennellomyces sp. T-0311]
MVAPGNNHDILRGYPGRLYNHERWIYNADLYTPGGTGTRIQNSTDDADKEEEEEDDDDDEEGQETMEEGLLSSDKDNLIRHYLANGKEQGSGGSSTDEASTLSRAKRSTPSQTKPSTSTSQVSIPPKRGRDRSRKNPPREVKNLRERRLKAYSYGGAHPVPMKMMLQQL